MAYTNTYTRINWQNLPSEATALNDVNLNKMDAEIYNHGEEFETVDTAITNINASLANKVDKEAGKGLSTNDYTTVEQNKLAGIEAGAQVNTVTGVKGNSEGSYRTGNVNITKAHIGLGNVDNTSDANKPVSTATQTALNGKVDKVTGKGLSTNDYTTAEKNKLAGIEAQANKTIVDSALSTSSTNPVQNKIITEALREIMPEVTVTGNPISISDGSNVVPAKTAEVTFLPKQDLHGYDNPWVGGAGVNKMPSLVAGTYEVNGLKAVVNSNGLVTVTGQKTVSTAVSIDIPFEKTFALDSTKYVKVRNSIAESNVSLDWGGYYFGMAPANRIVTPNDVATVTRLRLYHSASLTSQLNYTLQPSIEDTNTVTDWTPYSNECPISGWTELNLTVADAETSPTQTETYTETLGATYYGGKVDFVSGTATITHAIVDLSDYTWSRNTAGTYGYWWKSGFTGVDLTKDLIAEQYKGYKADLDVAQGNKIGITVLSNNNLYVCTDDSVNEPDGLLCYPLVTPITLTLTPTQIALLKGNNVLTSDSNGNIKLVYSADIKAFIESQLQNS